MNGDFYFFYRVFGLKNGFLHSKLFEWQGFPGIELGFFSWCSIIGQSGILVDLQLLTEI